MSHSIRLSVLLRDAGIAMPDARDAKIDQVTDDSRKVKPGTLFVATAGTRVDGHQYVADAVERGAAAAVIQKDVPVPNGVTGIKVSDSREALGCLAHAFYGNPSQEMLVLGISGTNGKTTTTYLLESILREAGYNPGVIGTIEYRYAGRTETAVNTTPSSIELARLFSEMRRAGINAVAMEVSSHAIDQRRIAGIEFDGGILTNITQDHLDYHGTMEIYAAAKRAFYFDDLLRPKRGKLKPEPVAAFNADDPRGVQFYDAFPGKKISFGSTQGAGLHLHKTQLTLTGTAIEAQYAGEPLHIQTSLVGMFNVMNVLGAVALTMTMGFPLEQIKIGILKVGAVPGRFEKVDCGQNFLVIVDYAHTPDALERVLTNARRLTHGRLITVFGCGGDRDNAKRPIMGKLAGDLSDHVVVTNDNPRTEDPERISAMVIGGVKDSALTSGQWDVVLDRKLAIQRALELAREGDTVVIAGKGHEDYQILNSGKIHFDDREAAREWLNAHGLCRENG